MGIINMSRCLYTIPDLFQCFVYAFRCHTITSLLVPFHPQKCQANIKRPFGCGIGRPNSFAVSIHS